jgi:hypothetical protein
VIKQFAGRFGINLGWALARTHSNWTAIDTLISLGTALTVASIIPNSQKPQPSLTELHATAAKSSTKEGRQNTFLRLTSQNYPDLSPSALARYAERKVK